MKGGNQKRWDMNNEGKPKSLMSDATTDVLLSWHRKHIGLYKRVAKRLGLDPSYVSRVANGRRMVPRVRRELAENSELCIARVAGLRVKHSGGEIAEVSPEMIRPRMAESARELVK